MSEEKELCGENGAFTTEILRGMRPLPPKILARKGEQVENQGIRKMQNLYAVGFGFTVATIVSGT